ncbi:Homeodomain-like [Parasponia andersonii]|uniref:Homeodomain-like n=1 Tax=Parasponia andersonii TaxID=3476 RepID=A0A2P5C304_PARAD|nr:Homeodomain-like [Parasponia andersonii]
MCKFAQILIYVLSTSLLELRLLLIKAITLIGLWTSCIFHLFVQIGMRMKRHYCWRVLGCMDFGTGTKLRNMLEQKADHNKTPWLESFHQMKSLPFLNDSNINEESKKDPGPKPSAYRTAENGLDTVRMAPNESQIKDEIKVEEPQVNRGIGEKKCISGDEGPSMTELSSYNFKGQGFEVEYDKDAEQLLADMEFKDTDIDAEHELKLQRFKVFMQFHSKEEHEEFLRIIIEEHRIMKRIQDLKEAQAAGFQTAAEANRVIAQRRTKTEEIALELGRDLRLKPNHLKGELDGSPRGVVRGSMDLHPSTKDSSLATQSIASSLDDWDITGFAGADLLSDEDVVTGDNFHCFKRLPVYTIFKLFVIISMQEKRLCCEIRILPSHYLNMLQIMSVEVLNGKLTKKSDACNLFKVEHNKVDRVYDMLVKKGIAQA